jgi:hypothetical protein
MVLEDWVRLVYIYYIKKGRYWFTLEDFAEWVWKNGGKRISIYTIEENLEKMVEKGFLRKVYARYRNEWGLPIKRRRYMIVLRRVKEVVSR